MMAVLLSRHVRRQPNTLNTGHSTDQDEIQFARTSDGMTCARSTAILRHLQPWIYQGQTNLRKRYEDDMARVSGLEKKDAPWHLRWFYGVMRKMFRKDLTPAKIQMRLPGMVWGGIAMEAALGRKRLVSLRYIQVGKVRVASRVGCPF